MLNNAVYKSSACAWCVCSHTILMLQESKLDKSSVVSRVTVSKTSRFQTCYTFRPTLLKWVLKVCTSGVSTRWTAAWSTTSRSVNGHYYTFECILMAVSVRSYTRVKHWLSLPSYFRQAEFLLKVTWNYPISVRTLSCKS